MLVAGRFLNQFLTLTGNDRENIMMQTSSYYTSNRLTKSSILWIFFSAVIFTFSPSNLGILLV